jgi:hypothetical protein
MSAGHIGLRFLPVPREKLNWRYLAAAGGDDDRAAGGFVRRGEKGLNRRVMDVGEDGEDDVGFLPPADFLGLIASGLGARRAVGPERD